MKNHTSTNKIFTCILVLFLFFELNINAQQPFDVSIVPVSISGAPAIHSCSFAAYNGKWLFIGGRTNGLHGFLPPFGFPASSTNDSVFVVDPVGNQTWAAATASLPVNIREAVTSSNMEYVQSDSMLYMVGGYGYKSSISDYITFSELTAVDVNGLITAVMNGSSINAYFRQVTDSNLTITGGEMQKIDSTCYLVFGQKFDGRYDRSDTTGFFTQVYSNQIRKFIINDDGVNLSVTNYTAVTDTVNFHRRDFNLVPQIFSNGDIGFTAFSGVFQYGINLPYLNTVDITTAGYNVNNSFNQNLNQYNTARMPVYDSINNMMHTVFFGGISLYYIDSVTHLLTMDTLVPFVKTISKVTRDANGNMTEVKLNAEMPSLLGTNALFILDPAIKNKHQVIDLNALTGNTTVGYIVGGILSPEPNVSETDPALSSANTVIFKVNINKNFAGIAETKVAEPVNVIAAPNPFKEIIQFRLESGYPGIITLDLYDIYGEKIKNIFKNKISGSAKVQWNAKGFSPGIYYYEVKQGNYKKMFKIILAD